MTLPPLTPDQQKLVADNHRLAFAAAKRFTRLPPGVGSDDVEAAALAGLVRAAQSFKPDGPAKFSTYGWNGATNAVCDLLRRARKHAAVPFSALGAEDGGDYAATVAAPEADPRELPPDADAFWAEIAEALPDQRQRYVLRRRYRDGLKLHEVAAELEVSKERIRQLEAKAIAGLMAQKKLFEDFV